MGVKKDDMNAEDHRQYFSTHQELTTIIFGRNTVDKRVYLKIKLKSLAQEAKYIRREERRTTGDLRFGLHQHRVFVVRAETRATLLAYGYLNGKTHKQIEPNTDYFKRIDWDKVRSMVKRYGNGEQLEGLEAFIKSS